MLTEQQFIKLDKKYEKKNRLADAALELFLEEGYANTKIADIAKRAGVGKGTVYEYFESKESILVFVMDTRLAKEYAQLLQRIDDKDSVEDKLREYVEVESEFMKKYGGSLDEIRHQFSGSDAEFSKAILNSAFSMIAMEVTAVRKIVELGIKNGEFNDFNKHMMTNCICSQVISFLTTELNIHCTVPLPEAAAGLLVSSNYDKEEFIKLLLYGLRKN